MKIYIESHGCTRRKLEVSKFHRYFPLNGYTIVQKPISADIILVTTCAFKHDEEEASLTAIENLKKYDAKIIIYGCLPEIAPTKYFARFNFTHIAPKDLGKIDDYFEGITHKFADIDDVNLIDNRVNYSPLSKACKKFVDDFEISIPFFVKSCRYLKNKYFTSEQKYYLTTSRGCMGSCTYCAVRFAVGALKSKGIDTVIKEFAKGIAAGYRDFSVLGDDVGAYGQDRGSNFCELMTALFEEAESRSDTDPARNLGLHVEEINPRWIIKYADEVSDLFAHPRVKSLLCPLQSGNQRILELMNRRDDVDKLLTVVRKIQRKNPNLELNTQLIVGFPSETEAEFDESLEKVSQGAFRSVVLFPFDDKENTKAHLIEPKIPEAVINARVVKAQAVLRQKGIMSALCCNET